MAYIHSMTKDSWSIGSDGSDDENVAEHCRSLISRLPTELLAEIMQLSLPIFKYEDDAPDTVLHSYMAQLYSRRAVAKQWRSIVDETPRLWSFLASTLPPEVVEAIILKSRNSPLVVICSSAQSVDPGATWPASFLVVIKDTRHRWTSYNGYFAPGFFQTPAPLLHTIILFRKDSVDLNSGEDIEPVIDLLGGATLTLRDVAIDNIRIRWKTGMFSNLASLRLWNVRGDVLTSAQLLDFLLRSPHLEVLELQDVVAVVQEQHSLPLIPLNHLTTLHTGECAAGLIDLIIRCIQTPSCIQFTVGVVVESPTFDITRFFAKTLQPHHALFGKANRESAEPSELLIGADRFDWSGGSGKIEFEIVVDGLLDMDMDMASVNFSFIDQALENDSGVDLTIADVSDTLWEKVAPLHCVTKVSSADDPGELISRLGQPLSSDSLLPPFPGLQAMELWYSDWTTQELLDSLKSRYEALRWNGEDAYGRGLMIVLPRNPFRGPDTCGWEYVTLENRKELRGSRWVKSVTLSGYKDTEGTLGYVWDDGLEATIWGGNEG